MLQSVATEGYKADVIIEPNRPGVMEKLGLGAKDLMDLNPRLVYARLTGYGQTGPYKHLAGHDINYLASYGTLGAMKRNGEKPMFPVNILGDFAGGSLSCAFGILAALIERQRSGKGQVVDSAIADGTLYLSTFVYLMKKNPLGGAPAGNNLLDSGAPNYDVYETKDGLYVAVGSLEPQFYKLLLQGLGYTEEEASNLPVVIDKENWNFLKSQFSARFKTKTQAEWAAIFNGTDACVTPITDLSEAPNTEQAKCRGLFSQTNRGLEPAPAPRLDRTPPEAQKSIPTVGEHTIEILKTYCGYNDQQVELSLKTGSTHQANHAFSKL